jgi:hypothetical protein
MNNNIFSQPLSPLRFIEKFNISYEKNQYFRGLIDDSRFKIYKAICRLCESILITVIAAKNYDKINDRFWQVRM